MWSHASYRQVTYTHCCTKNIINQKEIIIRASVSHHILYLFVFPINYRKVTYTQCKANTVINYKYENIYVFFSLSWCNWGIIKYNITKLKNKYFIVMNLVLVDIIFYFFWINFDGERFSMEKHKYFVK